MAHIQLQKIKTITDFHRYRGLPKPEHPLISVVNFESIKHAAGDDSVNLVNDFYSIGLKRNFDARMKYGQQVYDFDEGIMTFMSPGQVLRIEVDQAKEL